MLAEPLKLTLQRVLREQRYLGKLRSHVLHSRRKPLLVGTSGIGKTMTAAALVGELRQFIAQRQTARRRSAGAGEQPVIAHAS